MDATVQIPRIGSKLDIEGVSYIVIRTDTYQDAPNEMTTIATILEITPNGEDAGKLPEKHRITHVI
jgi:hypothetical protein